MRWRVNVVLKDLTLNPLKDLTLNPFLARSQAELAVERPAGFGQVMHGRTCDAQRLRPITGSDRDKRDLSLFLNPSTAKRDG